MDYVGFWLRFIACIIDWVFCIIIFWLLGLLFGGLGMATPIILTILGIVYYIGFWVWKGATPGKMILGMEIVNSQGNRIGIGRAILRYIGYFVSYIIILIGYLMIAWDSKKQGLHDKIAGTYVVAT